ncbi:MAG TPA: copper resistance CopC family protein [Dehalococcoidia bacterium]|nr:copper resistance CopC family protein [Dehalococcoidia bacterium]
MISVRSVPRTLGVGTAIAFVALLAGLVLAAGPAAAHARYDHSDPADGASLASSPARVNVWFAQDVRRAGGLPTLIVVNETGDTVNLNAVLDDRDRTHMYADMPPALPSGRYTVIWHTLSDEDGEEAQGAFHFYIGVTAPSTPSVPTSTGTARLATPNPTPTPSQNSGGGGSNKNVPLWGLALGIVGGAIGGAGLATVVGRRLR